MWSHLKVFCQFKYEELGYALILLERSWWIGFNGIYFVSFALRMWEISKFKWFLSLQFQINYRKPGLEGKISWKCAHICRSYVIFQKVNIRSRVKDLINPKCYKTNFICWVSPILKWVHTWTNDTCHTPQTTTFHATLLIPSESSWWVGSPPTWFENVWSYGVEATSDHWTIFSIKIK
jgi:hypothetical protein